MRKIIAVIRKEISHLGRDRRSLAIIFVLPVAELLILGFASSLDVRHLAMAAVDLDGSETSRALIDRFTATDYFTLRETTRVLGDIDEAIRSGRVSLAVVIPADFEKAVLSGRPQGVEIVFDGSESYTASVGISYATIIVSRFAYGLLERSFLRDPRNGVGRPLIDMRTRVWFNPELASRPFLIPGIMAMLLMLVTILLPSLAVVKEKELGTLEQLIVTPIRTIEFVAGKLAPFFAVGLIVLTLVTLETWIVFGVGIAGNLILYYLFSAVFIFSNLGIGFLVSTFSNNQQQAMLATIFFFILPQILLSGFVFPIDNMPIPIQVVTYILPLRYFFVIIRGIFMKGAGFAEFWDELLALFVLAAVFYGLAMLFFKKRLD